MNATTEFPVTGYHAKGRIVHLHFERYNAMCAEIDRLRVRVEVAEAALDALVAADPGPLGHRYNPIDPDSVALIVAANDEAWNDGYKRSLRCWECSLSNDEARWNKEQSVGEHAHLMYDVMVALRAAVSSRKADGQ